MYRARFAPKYLASIFGLGMVLVLLAALRTVGFTPLPPLREAYSAPVAPRIAPSAVMTNGWTNLFPNLLAISAISSTEAWASGEYGHLIHYISGSWTAVDPPLMQGVDLVDISMVASDAGGAGWIAAGSKAYQYDGTAWSERSAGLGNGLSLQRISALSLNDAWGITAGPNCGSYSQIVHWDGSQWNTAMPPNTPYDLNDLKMASTSDGWSVGYSCTTFGPVVLHYDGATWSQVQVPSDPTLIDFSNISITGPNDIWALGNPYNNTRRAVYHYSGGAWTSWLLPQGRIPWGIYMADDNEGWVVDDQGIWHWDGQNWSVEYAGRYFKAVSGMSGQAWAAGLADVVMSRSGPGPWIQQWGGPTSQQLNHISMLSANETWAVGNAGTIVYYAGGSWQAVTSTISADLNGVQMLSPGDGYAVGGIYNSNGVIAHWDGVTWQQVVTTPTTLHSVYMVKSDDGWAVGEGGAIWHGAGTTWTQVASPTTHSLYAVALDSASHGWAVGGYGFGNQSHMVLLEYDGTQWVDRTGSLPYGVPFLNDLTLAQGGAEGWAVGGPSEPGPSGPGVILHLSDGVWTVDAQPPPVLFGVALNDVGTAWAVGRSSQAYYHSDGVWQAVQLPIGYTYPLGPSIPYGVAIVPGEVGWAVGAHGMVLRYTPPGPPASPTPTSTSTPTSGPTYTPTLSPTPDCQLDWHIAATPGLGALQGVAAISPNDMWAVGSVGNQTLIEHWDGTQWSVVPSPNPQPYDDLSGVAAISSTDVWAVGYGIGSDSHYSLTEHWDGAQWRVVPSPNVGTTTNNLNSVAAVSSNDVWAVGISTGVLVEHWDGAQWSLVPTPPAGGNEELDGVAAVGANDVWAVGRYTDTQAYHTLIEHWDGTQWSIVASPDGGTNLNILKAVTAISASDIWAVGYQGYQGQIGYQTLTLHWDGTQWTVVPSPNASTDNFIFGVTALSPNDVWAVGYYQVGGVTNPLTEHWNGAQWQVVGSPSVTSLTALYAAAGIAPDNVWGVGFYLDAQQNHALVERYYNPCTTSTPSPAPSITPTSSPSPTVTSAPTLTLAPTFTPSATQVTTTTPTSTVSTSTPSATTTSTNTSTPTTTPSSSSTATALPSSTQTATQPTTTSSSTPMATASSISSATASATPTHTATPAPSGTSTVTPTTTPIATTTSGPPSDTPTNMPTGTNTPAPSPTTMATSTPVLATPTACPIRFTDVPPGSTFYPFVRCLACLGIINGYPDGTFKPNNNVTRGQLSKIVSNAAGFTDPQPNQMFQDVPVGSTFQVYIGRLASRGYINGYTCGGLGEPCMPPSNLPYFRPNNNATRGQISKIDSNAAGYSDPPSGQQFEDVPVGSTYYTYTYRLVSRGVMGGYPCGGVGEPCVPPGNLPYFRPGNNATRGQTSKIVANTFFPDCNPLARFTSKQ